MAGTRPRVIVLGNFAHFRKSVLGKVAQGRFSCCNALEWALAPRHGERVIFFRHDLTRRIHPEIKRLMGRHRAINDTGFDIDKRNVQKHMHIAFGYSQQIDPLTHSGRAVVKSRRNAVHDGSVIDCPVERADPEKVYELLIDNEVGDGTILDIRVGILLGKITVVYRKYRPIGTRFMNANSHAEIVEPAEVLTSDEQAAILRFCASIRLEYGELDCLRDRQSGKLYIVDANNTPFGPPNQISDAQREQALDMIARAFIPHVVTYRIPTHRRLARRLDIMLS